jgi:hypothetical protein
MFPARRRALAAKSFWKFRDQFAGIGRKNDLGCDRLGGYHTLIEASAPGTIFLWRG